MKKTFYTLIICAVACITLLATSCMTTADTVGISSASLNDAGELIITYTDGTVDNLGTVRGNDGADGSVVAEGADAVAIAASSGLRSAVSVECNFSANVHSGGYFTSYGGGSSTKSYSSYGAGVIYKYDADVGSAFIITNYHVVYDSDSKTSNGISDDISVYIYGNEYEEHGIPATYVGGSAYYDIAVLYVEDSELLRSSVAKAVTVADSSAVTAGDTAIAIGNPEVSGISVTAGIVSVDSEYITMSAADNSGTVSFRVMRIDTAVNSGNSGGGLFNSNGELIGIVNAKASSSSVENIGYAIPSDVAIAVADNVIDTCFGKDCERVNRFSLGITVATGASRAVYDENSGKIGVIESVSVDSVSAGSASDGVLIEGDVILSITHNGNTTSVTREYFIADVMLAVRAGDTVEITVLRDGEQVTVTITADEKYISEY